jgi:hypothetical protein
VVAATLFCLFAATDGNISINRGSAGAGTAIRDTL